MVWEVVCLSGRGMGNVGFWLRVFERLIECGSNVWRYHCLWHDDLQTLGLDNFYVLGERQA